MIGAVDVVKAFIAAMHQWQVGANELRRKVQKGEMSRDDMRAILYKDLQDIYDSHLSCSQLPEGLVFTNSYKPEGEVVLEVIEDGDKVHVITDQSLNRPRLTIKYTLQHTEGGLKIEKRMRYSDLDNKFVEWGWLQ